MESYHYQGPEDFHRVQAALMSWVREAGHRNYLHKGDIGHRLFNDCYGYEPGEMMRYWLDSADEICAFSVFYPHGESFDLQVAPALWLSDAHVDIFHFCERETLRIAQRIGKPVKEMVVEIFGSDRANAAFMAARGYTNAKQTFALTRHDLSSLPEAPLPAGFRFHDATADDAAQLADVHNHSFTNKWNADSYGEVFRSPHMEYEFVVAAPDGRFAAFTNVWIDGVNRSLLFEPVGTHADFRRRGIGKALMVYVLRRMRAERGIECAYVCHQPPATNPASVALYASVGFRKLHEFHEYSKPAEAVLQRD